MTPWLAFGLSLVAVAVAAILLTRRIDARMRQDVALDEIKREVGGIITELNQTTERNIALIEDRIGKLEELTDRAERRIGSLQGLSDRDRSSQRTYSYLKPGPGVLNDTEAPTQETADKGENKRVTFRDQVRDLHRYGLPPEEIASRLGTTVGEVDLVISLDER